MKVSVVAVTVRFTVVVTTVLPLVPVTVTAPALGAMLGAVVIVNVTVDGVEPLRVTLP